MKTHAPSNLTVLFLIALVCLTATPTIVQAKREIDGQVFIVTKGSGNVKLGLVPIWVLGDSEMRALAKQAVELADAANLKKNLDSEVKKLEELEEKAVKELSVPSAQKVKAAVSEERQAMENSFGPYATLAERGVRLIEKINKQKQGIDGGEIFKQAMLGSEFATKVLVSLLGDKESDVDSDADGRFKIRIENGSAWVVAHAERIVGKIAQIGQTEIQNAEHYYWVVELPQKKSQIFLSTNNCDIGEAEGTLRVLASETKTSAAVATASAKSTLSVSGRSLQVYSEEKASQDRMKAELKNRMEAAERAEKERIAAENSEKERVALIEFKERQAKAIADGVKDKDGRLLVLVPDGAFTMGDVEQTDARVHSVNVGTFFMGQTEVTYGEWKRVLEWSKAKGYVFDNNGRGNSDKHPVTDVSWYDVVKWCNAKSEKEGLSWCYKVNGKVYRKGEEKKVTCDWSANGYRLPTEAEWEKAARGGLVGKKFPNGDTLEKKDANFDGSGTVEVGSYPAHGYGLYDMAGNVCEWCWDWYGPYSGDVDPKGPDSGSFRVLRGGFWNYAANYARSAFRDNNSPTGTNSFNGFRLARGRLQSGEGGSR